ncbi:MAG: lamin tail domain-containing protein, partial [Bacteroidetes bacterium]
MYVIYHSILVNMQKILLFFALILFSSNLLDQCDELFFSEYVEGYANNKALEIYNPTDEAINLSGYSLARLSNGATSANPPTKVIQLPDVMLESNDVFVVVVDLTDTTQWNSQFDKPVWNGYNLIDTLFDQVSLEPLRDNDGNVIFGP